MTEKNTGAGTASWKRKVKKAWPKLQELASLEHFVLLDKELGRLGITALPDGGRVDALTSIEFLTFWDDFTERQECAVARGAPCLLVSSLPRSASVFFSYRMAEALGVPVGSITHHEGRSHILASILTGFARGGAINHDHFLPSPHNVALLRQAGVSRVLLRLRDPRDILVSLIHKAAAEEAKPSHTHIRARDFVVRLAMVYGFIKQWAAFISATGRPDVKVMWFEDMISDPPGYADQLASFYEVSPEEAGKIREIFLPSTRNPGEFNFREGLAGQWRDFFTREQTVIANDMLMALANEEACAPLELRSRLGLVARRGRTRRIPAVTIATTTAASPETCLGQLAAD